MIYIKPQLRKNIVGTLLLIGGLGWANLRIVGETIGHYPFLRGAIAIALVVFGLYEFKGGVR